MAMSAAQAEMASHPVAVGHGYLLLERLSRHHCQLLEHTCRVPSYVQWVLGGEPQSLVRLACDTH